MSIVLIAADQPLSATEVPLAINAGRLLGLGIIAYAAILLVCIRPAVGDAPSLFPLRAK